MSKKQFGQFYTKKYEYILQNFDINSFITKYAIDKIIEPFCGEGDLVKYVRSKGVEIPVDCYDIDPKIVYTDLNVVLKTQDTLLNPPQYHTNAFVITNPPYLARNKNKEKKLYDKYNVNDLYKCFLKNIIQSSVSGGIIIIPLNFLCSIRENDINLRKDFLEKYYLECINIFEEDVFADTSYTVCSIFFRVRTQTDNYKFQTYIYPSKTTIQLEMSKETNYSVGGELYNLYQHPEVYIGRYVESMRNNLDQKKPIVNTRLSINCIDSGSMAGKIKMITIPDIFYGKESSRTEASIYIGSKNEEIFEVLLTLDYNNICDEFNKRFNEYRNTYNSLFISNYRESKEYARKRVSFNLVYTILKNIVSEELSKKK